MESLESSLLEGFEPHSGGSTPAYSYDTTVTVQYRDGVCATSNMDYFDFEAAHIGSKHDIIGYRIDDQTAKKNVDAQPTSQCNCNAVHDEPHWTSCPSWFKSCNCGVTDPTGQHANTCPMSVFNEANKKDNTMAYTVKITEDGKPDGYGITATAQTSQYTKDTQAVLKKFKMNIPDGNNIGISATTPPYVMPTQYTKEQQAMHPMDRAEPQPKATRDNPIPIEVSTTNDYKSLSDVLERAYQQAAHGKGRERHAQDQPFDQQPMQTISQLVGSSDGLRYQAVKKIQEAGRMDKDAAIRELLGAINYIAGTIIYMESDK